MLNESKPVRFIDTALDDLRRFPEQARQRAGFEIRRLQTGWEPIDWKSMKTVGVGACEIRVRNDDRAFRVMYVAKFADAIYVLHCFEKRSEKTSKEDLALASKRYKALVKELGK